MIGGRLRPVACLQTIFSRLPGRDRMRQDTKAQDMEPLTEAQSKSLGSHCERAVYKNTKGAHGANPLFIRVGESRIYAAASRVLHKALLKEVTGQCRYARPA